ncbi:Integrator complex subunit 3 [Tieghemiomyces parasiticus]|uniref:Integrator complex subunit 3 n=1 Tax=Tieghemiomyces parasiticus TaxID=78921 RepID=A0A9W8AHZ9_9FUNG|nr:Integrator complex subunit 3 [Tieghemiomyces parasiticus]
MLNLFERRRTWLYENPFMISSAVYHILCLLPDHQRFTQLREKEVQFASALLRDKFLECCHVGRDLVRTLQNVAQIPEFRELWITLLTRPQQLSPHFKGLPQLLAAPTPKMYLQSRLTFDMETKLLFIMERRNLVWFTHRFLSTPESETLYSDVIRYICGVYHPPNAILASDIVPRYVILGTLLRSIKSPVAASNVKLALFYDWLFYDPKLDSIMSIEPAILLMERSLEKYAFFTTILVEFLYYLTDDYYPPLRRYLKACVAGAMHDLIDKTVIKSRDVLIKSSHLEKPTLVYLDKLFGLSPLEIRTGIESARELMDTTGPETASHPELDGMTRTFEDATTFNATGPLVSPTVFDGNHPAYPGSPSPPSTEPFTHKATAPGSDTNGAGEREHAEDGGVFEDNGPTDNGEDGVDLAAEQADQQRQEDEAELIKAAADPGLWMFESHLADLDRLLSEGSAGPAVAPVLSAILETFQQTAVAVNVVGAALTLALRKAAPGMLEGAFNLAPDLGDQLLHTHQSDPRNGYSRPTVFVPASSSDDPDAEPNDALLVFCSTVAERLDSTTDLAVRTRLLSLVATVARFVEGITSRWLLRCLQSACDRSSATATAASIHNFYLDVRENLRVYHDYLTLASPQGDTKAGLTTALRALQDDSIPLFYGLAPFLYQVFSDLCVGCAGILHVLVSVMDQAQVFTIGRHMTLGQMSIFGEVTAGELLVGTLEWETFEQLCIWQLLNTEASGRPGLVGRVVDEVLPKIDPDYNPEALNGMLTLLCTVPPTDSLLCSLIQASTEALGDFVISALVHWLRTWSTELLEAWDQLTRRLPQLPVPVREQARFVFSRWVGAGAVANLAASGMRTIKDVEKALGQLQLDTDGETKPHPATSADSTDDSLSDLSSHGSSELLDSPADLPSRSKASPRRRSPQPSQSNKKRRTHIPDSDSDE